MCIFPGFTAHMSESPETSETSETPAPRSGLKRAFVWIERAFMVVVAVFAFVRLGPQFGALLGVGPALGQAPAYSVQTITGDTVHSADLLGKVVVVNFWATWCGPCKMEMPSLQKLHERRAGDDVVVLGLSTDVGAPDLVRAFLRERDITFPVGQATQYHRRAFGGIPGIPTTFVIDKAGVIRHRVVGYFAPPALHAAIARLVAENAVGP